MSAFVFGPDVEFDLNEIWAYIAEDKVEAADGWIARSWRSWKMSMSAEKRGALRLRVAPAT